MAGRYDDDLAWLALAELAVGDSTPWRRLAARLGGPAAVFGATDRELLAGGMNAAGIAVVRAWSRWGAMERRREQCRRARISYAEVDSAAYPGLLREVGDAPLVLYFRGARPADLAPAVAVVGSRRATRYGRRVAHELSRELAAAGVAVVSGMAIGIDAAAHVGALASGTSAAVLACGLDRPYPRSNRHLFDLLIERGSVVAEHPPGTRARRHFFPARNRIVTGMARALVVVEAAERSGSLVSARLALDQGRDLFAVPGNIDSDTSRGTNALLRDGCTPALEAGDVLDALGIEPPLVRATSDDFEVSVSDPDVARVFATLESSPMHVDSIAQACGLDGARVLELLTTLELDGLAERAAGAMYSLSARAAFARTRGKKPAARGEA